MSPFFQYVTDRAIVHEHNIEQCHHKNSQNVVPCVKVNLEKGMQIFREKN